MSDNSGESGHWTLDKKIPVALIITLCGYIVIGVWQFSALHSSKDYHERRISQLEAQRSEDVRASLALRDAVMELRGSNAALAGAVSRLEATLDRLAPRTENGRGPR